MVEEIPPDPPPAAADEHPALPLAVDDEATLDWHFPVKSRPRIVRQAMEIAAAIIVGGTLICFLADMLGIARAITSLVWPAGLVGCLLLLAVQLTKGPWL